MSKSRRLFPALRCRMGETIYYVSYLTFRDVTEWVKPTDEVHQSKKLSGWIQRQLIKGHAEGIAQYLIKQKERFFNALVVGIYGGKPSWAPLSVTPPPGSTIELTDEDRENLGASVGILFFRGDEKLFAIDGQPRVAGIKKAVEGDKDILEDEIVALFVGHELTKKGGQRTRRLFTTLNKTARRVSDADRIALDEDDGFAVITRRLIDDFKPFKLGKFIDFAPSAALRQTDENHITTIINLYHQIRDLYFPALSDSDISRADFTNARPPDEAVDYYYDRCVEFWTLLRDSIPEVKEVLEGTKKAGHYRDAKRNRLLMRPIGQRAFAGATGVLTDRGASLKSAVEQLSEANLWIHHADWHGVLWDPVQKVMLKSAPIAETFLLHQLEEEGRSANRTRRLQEILGAREE
jgi:DNA sulfur modification protein DndB